MVITTRQTLAHCCSRTCRPCICSYSVWLGLLQHSGRFSQTCLYLQFSFILSTLLNLFLLYFPTVPSTALAFHMLLAFLCVCVVLRIFSFPYVLHLSQHYWGFLDDYSSVSSNPPVLFTQCSSSLICSFETFQGFICVNPEAAKLWGFLWLGRVF